MTPLDAARSYAARGRPVFPCHWQGELRKRPLTAHGLHDASRDRAVIDAWWRCSPDALIGIPTGQQSGFVVLDIDVKDDCANGFDSLEELGFAVLPVTPMVHTASGGLHLYFALLVGVELRNTAGERGRGIGPGLDWRGEGGYVIAPSSGSGYGWDPIWNLDTAPLAPVPVGLMPREPERVQDRPSIKSTAGLSPYAEAALDRATHAIINAPCGQQEATLNAECFSIGTLAGASGIPAEFARKVLLWAAQQMRDHDPCRPWRLGELELKVARAFANGMRHPRDGHHAA